jgi:hypothetical protein
MCQYHRDVRGSKLFGNLSKFALAQIFQNKAAKSIYRWSFSPSIDNEIDFQEVFLDIDNLHDIILMKYVSHHHYSV